MTDTRQILEAVPTSIPLRPAGSAKIALGLVRAPRSCIASRVFGAALTGNEEPVGQGHDPGVEILYSGRNHDQTESPAER